MQQGYTGPEVCKITGISYRQLDHWTSTKLISASIRNIKGSGFHRIYSFNDIVLVKLVNKLRSAGISLQKIRIALKNIAKILGKNTGDDFKEGKITLPIILAYGRSDDKEKKFWKRTLKLPISQYLFLV